LSLFHSFLSSSFSFIYSFPDSFIYLFVTFL
jgi:hypothetical protein